MSSSNQGTPFTPDGWANVIADIRRLFALVGGGANDLNQASTNVSQDATATGENANNAFKIRNVNVATTAPVDTQLLGFSSARKQWEPLGGATSSGGAFLQAGNNLSDVGNVATARSNLGVASSTGVLLAANNLSDVNSTSTARSNIGLGTGNSPTFNGLSVSTQLIVYSGTQMVGGWKVPIRVLNGSISQLDTDVMVVASGGTVTFLTAASNGGKIFILGSDPGSGGTPYTSAGVGQSVGNITGATLGANRTDMWISDNVSNWYRIQGTT